MSVKNTCRVLLEGGGVTVGVFYFLEDLWIPSVVNECQKHLQGVVRGWGRNGWGFLFFGRFVDSQCSE